MKLIQLNIWWGGKLDQAIVKFLNEEKPDILCLQESASMEGKSGMMLSVEQIKEIGNFKDLVHSPLVTFNFMHRKVSMGNAILSKFSILNSKTLYTHLKHNKDFDWEKHDYNIRNLLHCELDTGKQKTHVLTHHGYHVPTHKDGNQETLKACKQIMHYIDSLNGPKILAGDFNLSPNSESLEVINKKMTNLVVVNKLKTTRTNLTYKTEVCDYIFINKEIRAKKFTASDEVVSDHKALIMEFEV